MLRLIMTLVAIIGVYLWFQPPLLVVSELPPCPPGIEIEVRAGVAAVDVDIARRAVILTAGLLESEYSLALDKNIKLVLVPDRLSYYAALQKDEHLPNEAALFQATSSFGTSLNGRIILAVGAVAGYNDTLFLTAHEMTHQYQLAETGHWGRLYWLMEGMADMVAAQAVNANTADAAAGEAGHYPELWLNLLRVAPELPRLSELDTRQQWLTAMAKNAPVAYRKAGLAVLKLTEYKGSASFKIYMTLLKQGANADQAFAAAFGLTADEFVDRFETWLVRNL
jgi:hypothetical protein